MKSDVAGVKKGKTNRHIVLSLSSGTQLHVKVPLSDANAVQVADEWVEGFEKLLKATSILTEAPVNPSTVIESPATSASVVRAHSKPTPPSMASISSLDTHGQAPSGQMLASIKESLSPKGSADNRVKGSKPHHSVLPRKSSRVPPRRGSISSLGHTVPPRLRKLRSSSTSNLENPSLLRSKTQDLSHRRDRLPSLTRPRDEGVGVGSTEIRGVTQSTVNVLNASEFRPQTTRAGAQKATSPPVARHVSSPAADVSKTVRLTRDRQRRWASAIDMQESTYELNRQRRSESAMSLSRTSIQDSNARIGGNHDMSRRLHMDLPEDPHRSLAHVAAEDQGGRHGNVTQPDSSSKSPKPRVTDVTTNVHKGIETDIKPGLAQPGPGGKSEIHPCASPVFNEQNSPAPLAARVGKPLVDSKHQTLALRSQTPRSTQSKRFWEDDKHESFSLRPPIKDDQRSPHSFRSLGHHRRTTSVSSFSSKKRLNPLVSKEMPATSKPQLSPSSPREDCNLDSLDPLEFAAEARLATIMNADQVGCIEGTPWENDDITGDLHHGLSSRQWSSRSLRLLLAVPVLSLYGSSPSSSSSTEPSSPLQDDWKGVGQLQVGRAPLNWLCRLEIKRGNDGGDDASKASWRGRKRARKNLAKGAGLTTVVLAGAKVERGPGADLVLATASRRWYILRFLSPAIRDVWLHGLSLCGALEDLSLANHPCLEQSRRPLPPPPPGVALTLRLPHTLVTHRLISSLADKLRHDVAVWAAAERNTNEQRVPNDGSAEERDSTGQTREGSVEDKAAKAAKGAVTAAQVQCNLGKADATENMVLEATGPRSTLHDWAQDRSNRALSRALGVRVERLWLPPRLNAQGLPMLRAPGVAPRGWEPAIRHVGSWRTHGLLKFIHGGIVFWGGCGDPVLLAPNRLATAEATSGGTLSVVVKRTEDNKKHYDVHVFEMSPEEAWNLSKRVRSHLVEMEASEKSFHANPSVVGTRMMDSWFHSLEDLAHARFVAQQGQDVHQVSSSGDRPMSVRAKRHPEGWHLMLHSAMGESTLPLSQVKAISPVASTKHGKRSLTILQEGKEPLVLLAPSIRMRQWLGMALQSMIAEGRRDCTRGGGWIRKPSSDISIGDDDVEIAFSAKGNTKTTKVNSAGASDEKLGELEESYNEESSSFVAGKRPQPTLMVHSRKYSRSSQSSFCSGCRRIAKVAWDNILLPVALAPAGLAIMGFALFILFAGVSTMASRIARNRRKVAIRRMWDGMKMLSSKSSTPSCESRSKVLAQQRLKLPADVEAAVQRITVVGLTSVVVVCVAVCTSKRNDTTFTSTACVAIVGVTMIITLAHTAITKVARNGHLLRDDTPT